MFVNRLEFSLLIGQCDVSCELCVNLKHLTLASHATAWIWSLFERNNYLKKKCTQNDISVIIYSRCSEPVEQVPRILKLYDSFVSGTNRNAKTPTHLWNLICIYRLSQVRRHIELNKAVRDKHTHCIKFLDRNFHKSFFLQKVFFLGKTVLPRDNRYVVTQQYNPLNACHSQLHFHFCQKWKLKMALPSLRSICQVWHQQKILQTGTLGYDDEKKQFVGI